MQSQFDCMSFYQVGPETIIEGLTMNAITYAKSLIVPQIFYICKKLGHMVLMDRLE